VLACPPDPKNPRDYTWFPLPPKDLGCSDVVGCTVQEYRLSVQQRNGLALGLRTQGINVVGFPPVANTSISDPGGWGDDGRWPVWFFCVFLAMKFAKALEEFLFRRKDAEAAQPPAERLQADHD
jgi:hypothetical protein